MSPLFLASVHRGFPLHRRRVRHALLAAAAPLFPACGGGGAAPIDGPTDAAGGSTPPAEAPAGGAPEQPAAPPGSSPPAQPTPPPPAAPTAPSTVAISTANRSFSPTPVTIAAGGTVTWDFVEERHNVVFIGAAPSGGSIPDTEEGNSVSRTFSAPGTYNYECTRHRDKGMRGTIVVESGAAPTPPPVSPPPASPPPTGASSATVGTPSATFSPASVTIAVGGTVTWQFSEARHNVTFQGTAPAGGNIPDSDPGSSASRTFGAPGTYSYLCTRHSGMSGRVLVQ